MTPTRKVITRLPFPLVDGMSIVVDRLDPLPNGDIVVTYRPAADSLRERIAEALCWPLRDVESMSFQALRELLRPVNPKLVAEIDEGIRTGSFIR